MFTCHGYVVVGRGCKHVSTPFHPRAAHEHAERRRFVKRAIVLQHVAFEGPARLTELLSERGFELEVLRLDRGAPVPERIDSGDVLIVMGGPMGVADIDRAEFPFLRPELQLLVRCIEDASPVLGVCLGAQLLAFAAGANVQAMISKSGERRFEVGWAPVTFHPSGTDDRVLAGAPEQAWALHWHGDACELPAGARRLASTALCANQAFQLGTRQFGLQFHCEVAPEHVSAFLDADTAFVTRALGPSGVERIRADTARYAAPAWEVGRHILGNILDAMRV